MPKSSKDKAPDAIEKLVGDVALRGKEILDDVSEWGFDDIADDIKAYIKKNPLKSVGMAVGMGFVLSSLFKSSRGEEKHAEN